MLAFICTARAIISNLLTLLALRPRPKIDTWPLLTSTPIKLPLSINKAPVESITLGVLINPQPLQVIPLALASTNSALCPSISVYPNRALLLTPVTSARIIFALPPARCLLPSVQPPSVDKAGVKLLLKITPPLPTLKSVNWLCDTPLLVGCAMSTTVVPLADNFSAACLSLAALASMTMLSWLFNAICELVLAELVLAKACATSAFALWCLFKANAWALALSLISLSVFWEYLASTTSGLQTNTIIMR